MFTSSLDNRANWLRLGAWLALSALLAWGAPFANIEDLPYLDLAAWPEPEAAFLHRFGHIYLLKAFVFLAPSPLWGARLFWGAALGASLLLMAALAARLFPRQPRLAGFAAVLLFLGGFFKINQSGALFPELTTLLGTLLGIWLFLRALEEDEPGQRTWLAALGFVLVWAVRSSGAGWLLAALLPGLAWRFGARPRLRALWTGLGWAGLGALTALLVFIALDGFFLEDALFSLRPANQLLAAAAANTLPEGGYRGLVFGHFLGGGLGPLAWLWMLRAGLVLWLPLLLSLVVAVRDWRTTPPARRVLGLLPWGWLLAPLFIRQAIDLRWLIPALAAASVLGAGALVSQPALGWRTARRVIDALLKRKEFYLLAGLLALHFGNVIGWNPEWFAWANYRFLPLLALLGVAAFNVRWQPKCAVLGLASLLLLNAPTALDGGLRILTNRAGTPSRAGYALLETLRRENFCARTGLVYISGQVGSDAGIPFANPPASARLLRLGLGCAVDFERITVAGKPDLPADLLGGIYADAFITAAEYETSFDAAQQAGMEQGYTVAEPIDGLLHFSRGGPP